MKKAIWQACIALALAGCAADGVDSTSTDTKQETSPSRKDGAAAGSAASDPTAPALAAAASNQNYTQVEGKAADEFVPPPVAEGFMRLEAATVSGIEAGGDVTSCQYLTLPVDHDMNILAVQGAQSAFGHHVVAFSYTATGEEELGKSFNCGATEFTSDNGMQTPSSNGHTMGMGGFLGSSATGVPDGVAYRLQQGDGIMLNIHFINSGEKTISGKAYLDVKLAEVDPNQKLASLFTGINAGFDIEAHTEGDSSVDCVVQSDLQVLMMSNHMHEYGVNATTDVVRADSGDVEVLRNDDNWTPEMQFNPNFTKWTIDEPFMVHAGDTLRTHCSWKNTSDASLTFPREMCISAGFVLTTGDQPTAPGACANGKWMTH
jgi:hypothetical protein